MFALHTSIVLPYLIGLPLFDCAGSRESMTSHFIKIPVESLEIGMFVSDLDRSWLESPFLLQGFTINGPEELQVLRDLCQYVFIDPGLTRPVARDAYRGAGSELKRHAIKKIFSQHTLRTHQDTRSFEDELQTASTIYNDYERLVTNLYDNYRQNRQLDVAQVSKAIDGIVSSVMRNPDACTLLSRLRRKDDYTYNHAIGSSIWAAAMGRQIGLPVESIKNLSTGLLLCDIGKLNVSSRILSKTAPLSEAEISIVREHVSQGMEMLKGCEGIHPDVADIVAHHHERYNGSGYPRQLKNEQIPVFARIAGIIDTYDAMINDRPFAAATAPADVIARVYTMRDVDFQAELVEEFIQTIGIYPAGSLVELTNGEVGVVVCESRKRRLRPRILLLLDSAKQALKQTRYINLLETTHDERGRPLEILKGLDPGAHGLDPEELLI